MRTLEIKKNLYYVGVLDKNLRLFDVAIKTDFGTSYNSYLLDTDEGLVVFEGTRAGFFDEYIQNIEKYANGKPIKYLVVSHTEPDHSGGIKKILEKFPDITVIASTSAHINLSKILRFDYKRLDAKADAELNVGQYTFKFISGSFLHWPDVIFTYIKELNVLISCDAYGCHYASDEILLSKINNRDDYEFAFKFYYDHIMGPFPNQVIAACNRIKDLDIDVICCGHGPVVDCDIKNTIDKYIEFATKLAPVNDKNKAVIVYSSAYGYTKNIAKLLQKSLELRGICVFFHEIDALNYDELKPQIIDEIRKTGTLLLGSPTINSDAIPLYYDLLASIPANIGLGKKASAFGDYGWSGEAVPNLLARLKQLRFSVVDGVRINFEIDETGLSEINSFIERL